MNGKTIAIWVRKNFHGKDGEYVVISLSFFLTSHKNESFSNHYPFRTQTDTWIYIFVLISVEGEYRVGLILENTS